MFNCYAEIGKKFYNRINFKIGNSHTCTFSGLGALLKLVTNSLNDKKILFWLSFGYPESEWKGCHLFCYRVLQEWSMAPLATWMLTASSFRSLTMIVQQKWPERAKAENKLSSLKLLTFVFCYCIQCILIFRRISGSWSVFLDKQLWSCFGMAIKLQRFVPELVKTSTWIWTLLWAAVF